MMLTLRLLRRPPLAVVLTLHILSINYAAKPRLVLKPNTASSTSYLLATLRFATSRYLPVTSELDTANEVNLALFLLCISFNQ